MSDAGYSVEDVARSARVRPRTIRRWAESHEGAPPVLPPSVVTVGGHRRYSQRDILRAQILGALRENGASTRVAVKMLERLLPVVDASVARALAGAQSLGLSEARRTT